MSVLKASRSAVAALLFIVAPAMAARGADLGGKVAEEYDLKAAFLFNFARFVEWPARAFATPDTPIAICILGESPFGSSLNEILDGEMIGNRSVVARECGSVSETEGCHILFVAPSENDHLRHILSQLAGRSVLTVGESDGFVESSGIVRFVVAGNRVRLRINVDSAKAAKLTISSKLLRQAEIVHTGSER